MKIIYYSYGIDKTIANNIDWTGSNYGGKIIEVDDEYDDCVFADFDNNGFNLDKYNARKQKENSINYEQLVVSKIRERYTVDQELAILRQRDTKPQEFAEYDAYVEQCKVEAKEEVNGR